MVYTLQKFKHYLLKEHFKMYIDHSALKYRVNKPVLGGRDMLMVTTITGVWLWGVCESWRLNAGPDHLSRIETSEEPSSLEEGLSNAELFVVHVADYHFADSIHFLMKGTTPEGYSTQEKKDLIVHTANLSVITGWLYKMGTYEILQRFVLECECMSILVEAHGGVAGGHYAGKATV